MSSLAEFANLFRSVATEETETGCLIWQGKLQSHGYGVMYIGNIQALAHRVAYTLAYGEIPAGHVVMHACDNPPCVNPAHLRAGTQGENARDMKEKGRASHAPKARGAANGKAILDEHAVREIREKHATGAYTLAALGTEYHTHLSNISLIVRRKVWTDV